MDYTNYLKNEKNLRRDKVLLSAAQLFLDKGIEAVKMTDVADACDMGVASLYRYFGTKTQLVILTGQMLWQDVRELFRQLFEDENYYAKNGFERLTELFSFFPSLLQRHRGFLKFIHEFDENMQREDVSPDALEDYESTLLSFFPPFEEAYRLGLEDGSVRKIENFERFYFTATHSLLLMCQKFVCRGILKSDTEAGAYYEIALMVRILMAYLQA